MRKVVCVVGETRYFIRPSTIRGFFLHGDFVTIRATRGVSTGKMPEAHILGLVRRSHESVLVQLVEKGKYRYLRSLGQYGRGEERYIGGGETIHEIGDILSVRFFQNGTYKILHIFAKGSDVDLEEKILLAVHHVRQDFSEEVSSYAPIKKPIPPYAYGRDFAYPKTFTTFSQAFHLDDLGEIPLIQEDAPLFQMYGERIDCRNWFTYTIDGADARDLDDALSLARYANGDILLAVHIADVAEYVQEGSPVDREALLRSTSIYTPGKVIPMLPEYLSNDLCSLHPGEPKLTLTCFMRVDVRGNVLQSDVRETIIESHHRGVYDDLFHRFQKGTSSDSSLLDRSLRTAHDLYTALRERRKREGKILFESTELYFDLMPSVDGVSQIAGIRKRSRNEMHMLIEECMVLANEEVAKWCEASEIPFLSRVHGLPAQEHIETIARIIELRGAKIDLEPLHIRTFMDRLDSPEAYFRISRLLLPKMSKATYSDKKFRHFGLALEYYAHFTSPIRRYPDLQVHRIIKEHLHETLTPHRIAHYQKILQKVAKKTSENERHAEEIERAFDALYMCRYMMSHVGEVFSGRISGITDFALFIELENGVEGMIFLDREIFRLDHVSGTLYNGSGKKLYQIGELVSVMIEEVNISERRILLAFSEKR